MLNQVFKIIRESKEIQQITLAKLIQKSHTYISRIERGELIPSLKLFPILCQALQVTYEELKQLHLEYEKLIKPKQAYSLIVDYFPLNNYIISLLIEDTIFKIEFEKIYTLVDDNIKPIINKRFIIDAINGITKATNKDFNAINFYYAVELIKKNSDKLFKIHFTPLESEYITKIDILKKACNYYLSINIKNHFPIDDNIKQAIPEIKNLSNVDEVNLSLILKALPKSKDLTCKLDHYFYLPNLLHIHNFIFGEWNKSQGYIIETENNEYYQFKIIPLFDSSTLYDIITDDYKSLLISKINKLQEIILDLKESLKIENKDQDNLLLPFINSQINILSLIKNFKINSSIENMKKDIISFGHEQLQQEIKKLKQENKELKTELDKLKGKKG